MNADKARKVFVHMFCTALIRVDPQNPRQEAFPGNPARKFR
jgi:hypothetical protein